jgi:hypothetical protein
VFHNNTQRLIDVWTELKGVGPAPLRSHFDPGVFEGALPQAFMLSRTAGLPFRLAGALLEDLHGKPLHGESFLSLWASESRAAIRDAAVAAIRGVSPAILYAEGRTDHDRRAGFEMTICPLTGPDAKVDRLVGLCQPISALVRLHEETVTELFHRLTVYAGASRPGGIGPSLRLAAVDGRRIA